MKIKKIYTFGTSHTAGGGFEFEHKPEVKEFYKNYNEDLTTFNFSWPGQLSKSLDIDVINMAKQGFGDEKMIREFFKIYTESSDSSDSLFIFEFAQLGRKEFYVNDINDYVICNYWGYDSYKRRDTHEPNEITPHNLVVSITNDYYNKNENLSQESVDYLEKGMRLTYSSFEIHRNISRTAIMFLSFLQNVGVNFAMVETPFIFKEHEDVYFKLFGTNYDLFYDANYQFNEIIRDNSITNETNGLIQDGHAGLAGNKLISNIVLKQICKKFNIQNNII